MELTFAQQSAAFLYSFVLGAGLAVFYGLIKFCRFSLSLSKAAVIVLDVFFMLVWAVSVFFFSLAFLSGYIRFYVFIGSLAGFLVYRLTFGRLLFVVYSPAVRFLRRAFRKICEKLKLIADYLLKIAYKILYNIVIKKDDLIRKHKSKKILPEREKNEFKKTKNEKGGFRKRVRRINKRAQGN